MGPSSRPDHNLNLGYLPQLAINQPQSGSSTGANSPVELPQGGASRYPLGGRLGTGSSSLEFASRLYPKRAREIQAQEGLSPQVWGPPASGSSTPLRETIPESPNGENFPTVDKPNADLSASNISQTKRARAGTLPSRFSPAGALSGLGGQNTLLSTPTRPSPSTSPFRPIGSAPPEQNYGSAAAAAASASRSGLLSRLRAGSMPQCGSPLSASATPFGSALYSSGWMSARDRMGALQHVQSINRSTSPAHSSFSRDSLADTDVKTLDYLGLVDAPQPHRSTLAPSDIELLLESQRNQNSMNPSLSSGFGSVNKNSSRFRSYSVNAKEKYAEDEDEVDDLGPYMSNYSGSLTPSAEASAAAYAVHEAVRQHNLEVQAFANLASASRPRARTAGVLDLPSTRQARSFLPSSSRFENSLTAADLQIAEAGEYQGLADAIRGMHLNNSGNDIGGEECALDGPTRALWLGNIPSSTTVSSLNVIFDHFGAIESTRVLTHKNCGFVNFENIDSAIRAKSQLNNKEIFPGAGPVRIGYAKVPSASATPAHNGAISSPSPDHLESRSINTTRDTNNLAGMGHDSAEAEELSALPEAPPILRDIQEDILNIVHELGATEEEQSSIAVIVDDAVRFDNYEPEIPAVPEPSHHRTYDAPRLREIRKRIDNNICAQTEIEETAVGMLPEIAELSSDYLGNTVVQKLFEHCSEPVKEAMLMEIGSHLAEIGVHKNGTWAAQKIIDVSRSLSLMKMVVENLRPYTVALFLDQFGNYVVQGCLRYQPPMNSFIFEAMLSRLWELAQGRFGARAMRACLESHYASKDQQRALAAAIAINSVQLATNANGSLLLTWYLDTCTFPRRRSVLAPRLIPYLVHLCTNKVAYLTVLKLVNQRNEPEARDTILQALFFSPKDRVLERVLSDQVCGATLIFKVLTTPFFDEKMRADVLQNVRSVLLRIKAQPSQGYKRLMDEVGLSTRGSGSSSSGGGGREMHGNRLEMATKQSGPNPHGQNSPLGRQQMFPPGMIPPPGHLAVDPSAATATAMNLQRTGNFEPNALDAFPSMNLGINGVANPIYPGSTTNGSMPLPGPMAYQQLQYQNAMLAAAAAAAGRPSPYFHTTPSGLATSPAVGYPGTPPPSSGVMPSSVDHFRATPPVSASPVLQHPAHFSAMAGGFGNSLFGTNKSLFIKRFC